MKLEELGNLKNGYVSESIIGINYTYFSNTLHTGSNYYQDMKELYNLLYNLSEIRAKEMPIIKYTMGCVPK